MEKEYSDSDRGAEEVDELISQSEIQIVLPKTESKKSKKSSHRSKSKSKKESSKRSEKSLMLNQTIKQSEHSSKKQDKSFLTQMLAKGGLDEIHRTKTVRSKKSKDKDKDDKSRSKSKSKSSKKHKRRNEQPGVTPGAEPVGPSEKPSSLE
jgi:hypothetical protein